MFWDFEYSVKLICLSKLSKQFIHQIFHFMDITCCHLVLYYSWDSTKRIRLKEIRLHLIFGQRRLDDTLCVAIEIVEDILEVFS